MAKTLALPHVTSVTPVILATAIGVVFGEPTPPSAISPYALRPQQYNAPNFTAQACLFPREINVTSADIPDTAIAVD
jgi:hypothetical protein